MSRAFFKAAAKKDPKNLPPFTQTKIPMRLFHKVPASEIVFLVSTPGHVLAINYNVLGVNFTIGYCRGAALSGGLLRFYDSFNQASDPQIQESWSVPIDLGPRSVANYSLAVSPEATWMTIKDGGWFT